MFLDYRERFRPDLPRQPAPHRVDRLAAANLFVAGRREFLAVEYGNIHLSRLGVALACINLIEALS